MGQINANNATHHVKAGSSKCNYYIIHFMKNNTSNHEPLWIAEAEQSREQSLELGYVCISMFEVGMSDRCESKSLLTVKLNC